MDEAAEARLLDAARRGSFDAFAEIIRRWRPAVYAFCLDVTGDAAEAARTTEATFRRLMASVAGLTGAAATRAYVFRAAWAALDDAGWFVTAGDDALTPGPEAALPAISRQRAGLAHLEMRQHLNSDDMATVLRVSPAAAAVVATRLPGSLDASLGPDAGALEGFADRPLPPADPEAAARIKQRLQDDWPAPAASAVPAAAAAPESRRKPLLLPVVALIAATIASVVAALLLLPGSPLALTEPSEPDEAVVPVITPTPTATNPGTTRTPPPTVVPGLASSPSPSATPTPTLAPTETPATPGAVTTPTPTRPAATPTPTTTSTPTPTRPAATPTPTAAPTSTPTATPTVTPTVCAPQIQANTTAITLPPSGQSTIVVFSRDSCGPANYAASSSAGWLTVSPAFGTIPGFGDVTLQVSANPSDETTAIITIAGPANTVTVIVSR